MAQVGSIGQLNYRIYLALDFGVLRQAPHLRGIRDDRCHRFRVMSKTCSFFLLAKGNLRFTIGHFVVSFVVFHIQRHSTNRTLETLLMPYLKCSMSNKNNSNNNSWTIERKFRLFV